MPSDPSRTIVCDAVIIGGGIAGLWTLARLTRGGFRVVLLESGSLGAGQTIASQGIIHGGIKYTLGLAEPGDASRAIAEMPGLWKSCLDGRGEVDLSAARVLSDHQHLWTTPGLVSRIAGFGASRIIRTEVTRLNDEARPPFFAAAPRGVDVYRVEEPVLDVASVIEALAAPYRSGGEREVGAAGRILRYDFPRGVRFERDAGGDIRAAVITDPDSPGREQRLAAARWIVTAGEGTPAVLEAMGHGVGGGVGGAEDSWVWMQTRPLHMVIVRKPALISGAEPRVFGHCLGSSNVPRLTINTARGADGAWVWYIGGQIAETGVSRTEQEQIEETRRELRACVPWADLSRADFSTFRINRAEGLAAPPTQGSRSPQARPDGPTVLHRGNIIAAWPTKLAFAPALAAKVASLMSAPAAAAEALQASDWPQPETAAYPWDERGWPSRAGSTRP